MSVTEGDILAIMPDCDAMITDVSAVGLDWLYLRTDRPIFITDRHHDAERLRRDVPVSRCADVITDVDVDRPGGAHLGAGSSTTSTTWPGRPCATTTSTTSRSATAPSGSSTAVSELVALRDQLLGATSSSDEDAITA